jgi:outer membrane lipoprotein LolB
MYRPALALLLLFLAACSALEPPRREPTRWASHSAQLAALQQWTARGKVALRSADAAESAGLVWRQQGPDTVLQLSGPLGVGATSIHSDGARLEIRRGEEYHLLDISTADAIRQSIGWDLPLQSLAYWLKGLPAPDRVVQDMEFDPDTGLLRRLTQEDWEVRYRKYGDFGGVILPQRLQISRGATEAKVLITHWQTAPR